MRKIILMSFLLLFTISCGMFVSEEKVIKAVEKQGYSNIKIVDKDIFFVDWHGCSYDDDAHFDALANNAKGQYVDIEICAGWPFKGVTIRTK